MAFWVVDKIVNMWCNWKLTNAIKSIYNNIKSRILANSAKSNYFSCYTAVRQGENLSPLLFYLFINDMESFLENGLKVLQLDDNIYDNLVKSVFIPLCRRYSYIFK